MSAPFEKFEVLDLSTFRTSMVSGKKDWKIAVWCIEADAIHWDLAKWIEAAIRAKLEHEARQPQGETKP